MFLAIPMVGITDIDHPFAVLQFDPLADESPAAVLAAQQASVPKDTLVGTGTGIFCFAFLKKRLRQFPRLTGHDHRQIVFMAELFFWVGEAEGLVYLIALALVADQCADVALILKDTTNHRRVPQIFLEDPILRVGQSLV